MTNRCRTRLTSWLCALGAPVVGLLACGGAPEPMVAKTAPSLATTQAASASPMPASSSSTTVPSAMATARVVLENGGIFRISFADSPGVKKTETDECTKASKGDAQKLAACLKDAEYVVSAEGMQLHKLPEFFSLVYFWTTKEAKDSYLHVTARLRIAKDGGDRVTFDVEPTKTSGTSPEKKVLPPQMVIAVADADTLVMEDPTRGKLVFKREP